MRHFFLALLLSVFFLAAPAARAEEAKSTFSDAQRAELTSLIRQFIVDNPQALIASVESFYNKQNENTTKQEGRLEETPQGLYDSALTPTIGPKDAPFTVVYFFDYNCGFCKQVDTDLTRLIGEEKNIKFLFKELPILNETSELASRWSLAADKQGKYQEFHSGLMQRQGKIDESVLESVAKEKGLDVAKLKVDAIDPAISDALQKNLDLARAIGVRGTPFFLFGKEKVPGAIGYAKMKELISQERDGVSAAAKNAAASQVATSNAEVESGKKPAVDPAIQLQIDRARAETKEILNDIAKDAGLPPVGAPPAVAQ
jgi:protein-disulfide isomerase